MGDALPAVVVFGYLIVALGIGLLAGRRGTSSVSDFVAGERAFGPVVMYFIMGATIFSAFALLGTPQRVVAKGSDAFYIIAYGSVFLVPLFFFGARVRRIGAREGFVTQAEMFGARYDSSRITALIGAASVIALLPYLLIQLKAAGIVVNAVTGWHPLVGGALVYGVVTAYVAVGGVRGVGWTNVLQGVAMLVVVWILGLWIPQAFFGGVEAMFDRVEAEFPQHLTLPGPDSSPTSVGTYSSEILVSAVGGFMFPHIFMKCFTARSARLVQLSVVLYPTFLFFMVPLVLLGYAALLLGGPADDGVLMWLVARPGLGGSSAIMAFVAFAVLAASMSTGDALLHAVGSIAIRDVWVCGMGRSVSDGLQTRIMRYTVVAAAVLSWVLLAGLESSSAAGPTRLTIVDLLLLSYAVIIQLVPLGLLGLFWRRANGRGALLGLATGLVAVLILFVARTFVPSLYTVLNPADLQIGVIAGALNAVVLVAASLTSPPMAPDHLRRFELDAAS